MDPGRDLLCASALHLTKDLLQFVKNLLAGNAEEARYFLVEAASVLRKRTATTGAAISCLYHQVMVGVLGRLCGLNWLPLEMLLNTEGIVGPCLVLNYFGVSSVVASRGLGEDGADAAHFFGDLKLNGLFAIVLSKCQELRRVVIQLWYAQRILC